MTTDRSQSQMIDHRRHASITDINTDTIIQATKPSLANIGKRASRGDYFFFFFLNGEYVEDICHFFGKLKLTVFMIKRKTKYTTLSEQFQDPMEKSWKEARSIPLW